MISHNGPGHLMSYLRTLMRLLAVVAGHRRQPAARGRPGAVLADGVPLPGVHGFVWPARDLCW